MAILVLEDICKTYMDKKANDHISLEIPEQSIFGLLGPNGAGKSTLIRIITNIIAADSGKIIINGKTFNGQHHEIIGYMPEERGLYKKMKVGELLLYLAQLKNLSAKEARQKIDFWMEKFDIQDWWNKKIDELSKGMQQKIQFIATVVHEPKLIILDEPFSGLDPINSNLIKDEIYELKERGASIIFSTHRMEQVEEICEEIALINDGKCILTGKVPEIKESHKEHKFSVQFEGEMPQAIIEGRYPIVERNDNNWIFQGDENTNANDFISYLLAEKVEIKAFQELLPSINEIFIKLVSPQEAVTA